MADAGIPQQVDGLWFPADLVILQAGNHQFRVFTVILKEKSSVFADMFAFPQPHSQSQATHSPLLEAVDGVPVVTMHDDPLELEVFLKAIFDSDYFMPPPAAIKFDAVIGILRLSHKYDVHFLRRRALEHLGTMYFSRLEDYRLVSGAAYEIDSALQGNLKTIQVAAEVGALWLLPDAYYSLGYENVESVVTVGASWDRLGELQKRNCLRVFSHETQIQPFLKTLSFLTLSKTAASETCEDWVACNVARLASLRQGHWSTRDVIRAWNDVDWSILRVNGLCALCVEEAKELYQQEKVKFWGQLPNMFGLPEWDKLVEMRETDLG
ncbi:hypothetical protein C8R43DRAFT_1009214 [Mycena crocata]|nr:hypothetical protein C8R43DRAFT_1009214 [Mycena crocata]